MRRALILLTLSFGLAADATENPYLVEAQRLYRELQFAAALEQLELAAQVPSNEPAQRAEIHRLRAGAYAAQGNRLKAREAFEQLLALDPDFEVAADEAPKIRAVFFEAKSRAFPSDFARLKERPAAPGLTSLEVVDPWDLASAVHLYTRRDSTSAYVRTEHRTIPRELTVELEGQVVQWYAQLVSSDGEVLAAIGAPTAPRLSGAALAASSIAEGRGGPPLPQRRWPWLLAGVALLSASSAAYLQAQSVDSYARVSEQNWAADARALHAQSRTQASVAAVLWTLAGLSAGGAAIGVAF